LGRPGCARRGRRAACRHRRDQRGGGSFSRGGDDTCTRTSTSASCSSIRQCSPAPPGAHMQPWRWLASRLHASGTSTAGGCIVTDGAASRRKQRGGVRKSGAAPAGVCSSAWQDISLVRQTGPPPSGACMPACPPLATATAAAGCPPWPAAGHSLQRVGLAGMAGGSHEALLQQQNSLDGPGAGCRQPGAGSAGSCRAAAGAFGTCFNAAHRRLVAVNEPSWADEVRSNLLLANLHHAEDNSRSCLSVIRRRRVAPSGGRGGGSEASQHLSRPWLPLAAAFSSSQALHSFGQEWAGKGRMRGWQRQEP
jgi:hypothetical protein